MTTCRCGYDFFIEEVPEKQTYFLFSYLCPCFFENGKES